MLHMTKGACAAVGLTASIVASGCAGDRASHRTDERPSASSPTVASTTSTDPSAARTDTRNSTPQGASAAGPSAAAQGGTAAAPSPAAQGASAAAPSTASQGAAAAAPSTAPQGATAAAPSTASQGATAAAPSTASQGATAAAPSVAPKTPSATRNEVQGRIERIDRADNVTIAGSEGVGLAFEQFKLDEKTEVKTPDGKKASVAELNEGDEVRASFSGNGDELHVDRVEVVPAKER